MRLLVATCADKNTEEYSRYTLPIHKMWAKRWGADFEILSNPRYSAKGMWNYRTLEFLHLFRVYDRILYVDADIIINEDCPNIFNLVPFDTFGAVAEDKGSRRTDRLNRIKSIQDYFGNIGWQEDYFNMGFYVVSWDHRDMFQRINGNLWEKRGYDGVFYSYQIQRLRYKYVDLGYKFNHMSMFSEDWNGRASRFDSHIIHYAGHGRFPDIGSRTRTQLIRDDIRRIYGK